LKGSKKDYYTFFPNNIRSLIRISCIGNFTISFYAPFFTNPYV
jgi:hypothetical protein